MRKWLTSFFLIAAMAIGVVGIGAHQQEGSCPMSNLPDCCKRAQSTEKSPAGSMARLCCKLNCSEPGSGGGSSSSNLSQTFDTGLQPHAPAIANVTLYAKLRLETRPPLSYIQSNAKYIQHLALLI
jgi:hypothetical protein